MMNNERTSARTLHNATIESRQESMSGVPTRYQVFWRLVAFVRTGGGTLTLEPRSSKPVAGAPRGYLERHEERPEQWGWHGSWGRSGRLAGWVVAALLVLMVTTTNYQSEYIITLLVTAAILVAVLVGRRVSRRHRWRS